MGPGVYRVMSLFDPLFRFGDYHDSFGPAWQVIPSGRRGSVAFIIEGGGFT